MSLAQRRDPGIIRINEEKHAQTARRAISPPSTLRKIPAFDSRQTLQPLHDGMAIEEEQQEDRPGQGYQRGKRSVLLAVRGGALGRQKSRPRNASQG